MTVVGFVGLGNMGRPMARNLLAAGLELVVRDADPAREAEFGGGAGSPEGFAGCDVVVTMLPNDAIVRDALVGWGIAAALKPSAVVVDMSSSNPTATRALGSQFERRARRRAGVPGGVPRAEAGTLSRSSSGPTTRMRSPARCPCWRRSATASSGSGRSAPGTR